MTSRSEINDELLAVAELMAQELQEFIDDAIQAAGGDPGQLLGTQELLKDWEAIHKRITQ